MLSTYDLGGCVICPPLSTFAAGRLYVADKLIFNSFFTNEVWSVAQNCPLFAWDFLQNLCNMLQNSSNAETTHVANEIRKVEPFCNLGEELIHDLAANGAYEELESGIVLFCHGRASNNWYALLEGSVDLYAVDENNSSVRFFCN
ncbi:hypothetical protein TTRE_0000493001 [Trichuris trichiura]|uniref:Cyclic nucleotide-binding domain-containing protein n=1 Tax=Trichuris trichiura TaxID=36087 RepID=A0A077ZAM4_TRITR|nr:hypothetical protein TTRE_0000493001 [Trichuris trichiura]